MGFPLKIISPHASKQKLNQIWQCVQCVQFVHVLLTQMLIFDDPPDINFFLDYRAIKDILLVLALRRECPESL
jgi:hypothetical protein